MDRLNHYENFNGNLFLDVTNTIREFDPEKYFVGAELKQTLKGVELGVVKIVAIRVFKCGDIRDVISFLIIGKPAAYLVEFLKRIYKKDGVLSADHKFMHLVVKYKRRNLENQNILMQEWWKSKQQLEMDL